MTASRAPRPIPLSIHAEDLLVAAAIIAALGDRPVYPKTSSTSRR